MGRSKQATRIVYFALFSLLLAVPMAQAQDEIEVIPEDLEVRETEEIVEGSPWAYFLRVGLGAAFGSSKNVIGNTNGNTWTFSLQLEAAVDFFQNFHEWRASLNITEAFTRTPVIDEFVKSVDVFELGTIYLYHIPSIPWFGPFARARMVTALLPGQDVRANDETYQVTFVNGDVGFVDARTLALTDAFRPLTFKETVGLFLQAEQRVEARVIFLLGFGARQTIADNQFAITDDDATPVIEVVELASFNQAGSEVSLGIFGDIADSLVSYRFTAEFMTPFINDLADSDDRSPWELTNIDIVFGLGIRPLDWLSIDYEFRALREPQLLEDFQISNTLLLTLGYTLFEQTRGGEE